MAALNLHRIEELAEFLDVPSGALLLLTDGEDTGEQLGLSVIPARQRVLDTYDVGHDAETAAIVPVAESCREPLQ
jgi:hypothetical protein